MIAENTQAAYEWLAESAINPDSEPGRRVIITTADEVEWHLGQGLTPLAIEIEIENGRLVGARTVPRCVSSTPRNAPRWLGERTPG